MASLTETLGANNVAPTQGVDIAGNLGEGIRAGIGLATAKEQIEATKMKVADQKMDLDVKKATAMMNRTKAIMFSNETSFEPKLKAAKAYADSINMPYNDEAIRATFKDENLRLSFQKGINEALNGGVQKDPSSYISALGDDTGTFLDKQQQLNYANSQQKNKDAQATKIEQMGNASKEKIAQGNNETTLAAANIATGRISEKEGIEIRKEARKENKQLDTDLFSIDTTLKDLEKIKTSLTKYSKNSPGGTGPLATVGGLTKYTNQDTEALDSAFRKVSLDSMVKMFAGMSKAVDTNAERRAFEATQPSLSLDDKTNMKLVDERIASAKAMKEKYLNAKKGVGYQNGEFAQDSNPNLDIEAKRQAALKKGIKPEVVDAYIQKLMSAGK